MSEGYEGTIESGQLIEALRSIAGRRLSGLLSVQGEPDLVSITFLDGEIVAADAMNRPAEDVLAGVLASRGLLSPADFASTVEPTLGTGRLASEVLLEEGLVPHDELLDAVREQTYGQVVRLLRWENGNFNWTGSVESPYQQGMEPISVAEALIRSAEELGVEGPLAAALPDLDEIYEAQSPLPAYRVVGRDGGWAEPGAPEPWLTPDEEGLLGLLERRRAGARLVEESGLDRYRARYGLYQLTALGMARPSAWGAEEEQQVAGGAAEAGAPLAALDGGSSVGAALDLAHLHLDERPLGPPAEGDGGTALGLEELEVGVEEPEHPAASTAAPPGAPRVRRSALAQLTAMWVARGLALGLVGLLATLLLVQTERPTLLLPFPWQAEQRAVLEKQQTLSRYQKIDRAVRTYYLLYGRPPESLQTLANLELLAAGDLYDPLGRWLSYSGSENGYVVQPVEGGEVVPGSELAADARADFFLNPKFVDLPRQRPDPVVLIE
ncbi:MAG TPA: DUF4388 domain-containing protein [Thermoanaerobaculia bacterium]|nr:DUF4388 domain-containing protein [Thermoanaerobaculia bacterium]